ncbi:MAG: sodium:calcium antiporter [bacterium]|nr:sodium:calcium antiporter [bacterium]
MPEYAVTLVLFFAGFFILVKGAQILVRGASSIAKIFNVSSWFIGIVLVGVGTSIPELSINVASALGGSSVGLSAIIGSNTFNLLVILGLSALFVPFAIKQRWLKDIWTNIGAVVLAAAVILLPLLGGAGFAGIPRAEGALLLGAFILWAALVLRRDEQDGDGFDYEVFTVFTSLIMVAAGLVGVFLGGQWVVNGAEEMALLMGVSPALVGLTAVAVGTSLPELTVSFIAILRRQDGIALGNVIGSNIFDFTAILGIAALVNPVVVRESIRFDVMATLLAAGALLFVLRFVGKRNIVTRSGGLLLLALYAAYLVVIIMRG